MTDSYPRLAARTARFTLGIPRNTLYRKLDRYGLRREPSADTGER